MCLEREQYASAIKLATALSLAPLPFFFFFLTEKARSQGYRQICCSYSTALRKSWMYYVLQTLWVNHVGMNMQNNYNALCIPRCTYHTS